MSLNLSTAVAALADLVAETAETAEHHGGNPLVPFIVAGTAFVVFLALGVVTWSYRDVANRSTRGRNVGHDSHAGH